MKAKNMYILICLLLVLLFSCIYSAYQAGKKTNENKEVKKEIKESEVREKTYKKEYDSVVAKNNLLEDKIKNIKPIFIQGKETIKYIDSSRIKSYTDTLCKNDVIALKKHLSVSDSLIILQDNQIVNYSKSNNLLQNIISEKDNQINLYRNKKPPSKPFGIGIIGGYGTDLKNGLTPFVGVGISYSIIRF